MEQSQKDHVQKKHELARIDACFASFLEHIKCGELDQIKQYAQANGYAQFTNWQDEAGRTPLWYAVSNNNVDEVRFLLDAKAHIEIADRWNVSPLNLVNLTFLKEHKKSQEILRMLQQK